MNEIPVYLFTGFMDSGKTSLIKDTLFEQGFAKEGKSLVICCEDGDAEFTDEELEKGSNWQLAQNNKSGAEKYFPIKAIPIARIKTRG